MPSAPGPRPLPDDADVTALLGLVFALLAGLVLLGCAIEWMWLS